MSLEELVGTQIPPRVVTIERGPVEEFATAVDNDHPAYGSLEVAQSLGFDSVPVPPTFVFVAGNWGAFTDDQPATPDDAMALVDLIAALRGDRKGMILHGSEEFEYHDPICVGDRFDVTGYVESAETKAGTPEKPGMSVLVVRTDYRPCGSDHLVATTRSTFLFRPAHSG